MPSPVPWRLFGSNVRPHVALLRLLTLLVCVRMAGADGLVFAADWPQWRGPSRDGQGGKGESLPSSLPANLKPRWHQPAGGGFASPVVVGARVFVADEQAGRETARALDAATGEERWRVAWADAAGDEWGTGPRCTPLVDEGRVYVQSLRGEFTCLDASDGRRVWGFSFERDYGVEFVGGSDQYDAASRRRGHNGAPVILGSNLYVAVGATNGATVVCFDKGTGRERWRSGRDETAYAALMTGRWGGQDQVVAYTAFALTGLDAATGVSRWRIPVKTHANRHVVTPVLTGNGIVVSSHSIGLRRWDILPPTAGAEGGAGAWSVREAWAAPSLKISLATPVEVEGHLYGQGPDRDFHCVESATGRRCWSQPGFGDQAMVAYAATLAVGRRILVATEKGELVLLAADPGRYVELGRAQVSGRTWSHPALAGGRLYLRDRREWYAYDLPAEGGAGGADGGGGRPAP